MLILAGVSLNAIIGDNGIITKAQEANIMSKFANYKEELGVNAIDDTGIYATGENLKKYISSMEDKDLEKFVIIKSKLLYVGTDAEETEIANKLGIGGDSTTSDAGATVKEVQAIVDGVVEVSEENKEKIPLSDEDQVDEPEHIDDTEGLIGTRLFDRSGSNLISEKWNILIEYDNQNKETARYGSGYYWLKKGQKYKIKGEEIEFKNDYVINYKNEEFTVLSGRAVNWNVKATLGVAENIVLNLDAMSFENGRWEDSGSLEERKTGNLFNFKVKKTDNTEIDTGIQKAGDVVYDEINKSLNFNKQTIDNPAGNTGYLKLEKHDVDFSQGFSFEIYGNLDGTRYKTKDDDNYSALGLFCRTSQIQEKDLQSMRFGWTNDNTIGKFNDFFGEIWKGDKLYKGDQGSVMLIDTDDVFFPLKKDFYLTVVYTKNVDLEKCLDKVEVYMNGELYGWTYYDSKGFNDGVAKWNNDDYSFYVGITFWKENFYFLNGSVYAVRLYQESLGKDEVKLNYDKTLKYRDSFKDEKTN